MSAFKRLLWVVCAAVLLAVGIGVERPGYAQSRPAPLTLEAPLSLNTSKKKGTGSVQTIAHFHAFTPSGQENGLPEGWTTWAARPEIAPRFAVDVEAGRSGHGALRSDGNQSPAAFGDWRRNVSGIEGGQSYHFIAYYRTQGVVHERRCVSARLEWLDADGRRARPPDYALETGKEGAWTKMEYTATAPENARSVCIELGFGWCAWGTVWWDDVQLLQEPPHHRTVRTMTIYCRPQETKSAQASVEQFCRLIEAAAPQKPDIICLPEGITVIGTGKSYLDVSESVPGPTTQRLGALAKRLHCYIVAGLYERVGHVIYNSAVLIGRTGEVVGTYRKTHLPREEVEAGLTPGDSYPVFQTDFGKIGIMICWDVQFPEPARAMALKGAEMILLPIWGGSEVLIEARAIEDQVYMVVSSYDCKTRIVDPAGNELAAASSEHPTALAEIDLDHKIVDSWLGDMKPRTWKERRGDIPVP